MNAQKIGEFIKEQRKIKSLTQKELADIINCTDKAVSRWETGRGIPEVSLLLPLSKALDVTVNELLSGERIEEEKLLEKTEEVIIATINDSNKKQGSLKKYIFALVCIIQFMVVYVTPATAQPGDEMGVIFFLFLGTMVTSFVLGITPISFKIKLLFALVVIGLFIPSVFILPFYVVDFEMFALYVPVLLIITLGFIAIGTGVNSLVRFAISKLKR